MIIHADMDAFYVSVELLDKPQLRDRPVAVGGPSRTRGVISAANYIARQYGVHSALPCAIATRRCPDLVLLKPRIPLYAEFSQKIKDIFLRYTPLIEPLALDEAFLDVTASEKLFGDTPSIGQKIKRDVRSELGLIVSVGIAPNKFIAKIASDINKPDGFVVVKENETQDFLDPLPVTRIWGIGKVSAARLKERHIHTIKDLRQLPQSQLLEWFGKHGIHLHQLANGIDARVVVTDHRAKSISHECTYDADLHGVDTIEAQLLHLTEQVTARLRHAELKGRTVTIKVRYGDFRTITRSHSIAEATDSTGPVWQVVKQTLLPKVDVSRLGIRLLGVGVSHFDEQQTMAEQIDLFADTFADTNRQASHIDKLADAINDKFGGNAIRRGKTVTKT